MGLGLGMGWPYDCGWWVVGEIKAGISYMFGGWGATTGAEA